MLHNITLCKCIGSAQQHRGVEASLPCESTPSRVAPVADDDRASRMMTGYVDALRTIVDIPEDQLAALDAWRTARGVSRAEAVRRAVAKLQDTDGAREEGPGRRLGVVEGPRRRWARRASAPPRRMGRPVSVVLFLCILVDALNGAEPARTYLREARNAAISRLTWMEAVKLRRSYRLNIFATARVHRRELATRNAKDFPAGTPGVVVPYLLA